MKIPRHAALWLVAILIPAAALTWPFVDVARKAPDDLALVGAEQERIFDPIAHDDIRFDFTSRADIQTLAARHDLHIYEVVSPCLNGRVDRSRRLWDDAGPPSSIYDSVGRVDLWSMAPSGNAYRTVPSGPRNSKGRIRYSLYVSPMFHYVPEHPNDPHDPLSRQFNYDLRTHPVDLCIYVAGAGSFGLPEEFVPDLQFFRSNTVVIPKGMVTAVLMKGKS
jgi:hypothetical protein